MVVSAFNLTVARQSRVRVSENYCVIHSSLKDQKRVENCDFHGSLLQKAGIVRFSLAGFNLKIKRFTLGFVLIKTTVKF